MIPVQDGGHYHPEGDRDRPVVAENPIRGEMRVSEVEGGGVPEAFLAAA